MKRQSVNTLLMAGVLLTGLAVKTNVQAAPWSDWLPKPALDVTGLKQVYAGVGMTNALVHVNAELPTGYGNAYVKVGGFLDGADEVAGQIGFRYPYLLTGTDKNGYYLGGFVGHIESETLDGEKYNRLGLGAELSYMWLNSSRAGIASIAVGAGKEKEGQFGSKDRAKPMILFGYSFNFGVY